MKRSSTETLIAALRVLARDIQSEDGVANAAIAEGAERMHELSAMTRRLVDIMERDDAEQFMDADPVTSEEWFGAIEAAKAIV